MLGWGNVTFGSLAGSQFRWGNVTLGIFHINVEVAYDTLGTDLQDIYKLHP